MTELPEELRKTLREKLGWLYTDTALNEAEKIFASVLEKLREELQEKLEGHARNSALSEFVPFVPLHIALRDVDAVLGGGKE